MLKKLWLLALSSLALLSPVLSFASANTVDWFTSSSDICKVSFLNTESLDYTDFSSCNFNDLSENTYYMCVSSSDVPYYVVYWDEDDNYNYVSSSYSCFPTIHRLQDSVIYFLSDYGLWADYAWVEKDISWIAYLSSNEVSYSSSAWDSDSDWSISVPSWFTDSVNWLVSNFAWSIGNYAPTLIIVWLGVVLLFTFWWVIRSWAVRMFSKKWR